jgi:hypothetical protein
MKNGKKSNLAHQDDDLRNQTESEKKIPYQLTILIQIFVIIWLIRFILGNVWGDGSPGLLWITFGLCAPGAAISILTLILSLLFIYEIGDYRYLICFLTVFPALIIGLLYILSNGL